MDPLNQILNTLNISDEERLAWKQLCFALTAEGQVELIKFLKSLIEKQNYGNS